MRRPTAPLQLALETQIHSLDPPTANDAVSRRIVAQIFDTLVDWDPSATTSAVGLRPRLLASLPTPSADGKTLHLQLQSGAAARHFAADPCLPGGAARPVTASDVAATLRRLDPAKHPAHGLLAGRLTDITADDAAATVTLHLTRPQPELPAILAHPMLSIVPPECLDFYDGHDAAHPAFALHPVGSGPFRLDHNASALPRAAVLRRRNDAPNNTNSPLGCPQDPNFTTVALHHFSDPEPALRSFQAGTLAAITVGQAQFAEVIADGVLIPGATPPGTTLHRLPTLTTTLLVFRMRDPAIGHHPDPGHEARNRALRQAIAVAFDGVRYHRVIRNNAWAQPRRRLVASGLGGGDDAASAHPFAPLAANVDQAREILASAGITGPVHLRYWAPVGEAERHAAAVLRDALAPLQIELDVTHRSDFLSAVFTGDAQIFGLAFDADYLDPANILATFTCTAADNFSGHCDAAYDAAFAAFATLPPGPARDTAVARLEQHLGTTVPVRPIDQTEAWYLVHPGLTGVVRDPLGGLRLDTLCWSE